MDFRLYLHRGDKIVKDREPIYLWFETGGDYEKRITQSVRAKQCWEFARPFLEKLGEELDHAQCGDDESKVLAFLMDEERFGKDSRWNETGNPTSLRCDVSQFWEYLNKTPPKDADVPADKAEWDKGYAKRGLQRDNERMTFHNMPDDAFTLFIDLVTGAETAKAPSEC